MIELIEALETMSGSDVDIYTKHKLFGDQHIQVRFSPETEVGFGFRCNNQIIYINEDDIIGYIVDNEKIIINGNMMTIKIIKIS